MATRDFTVTRHWTRRRSRGRQCAALEIETLICVIRLFGRARTFAAALYGRSETLKPDSEGRIILTKSLKAHTGVTDAVAFVGLGHKFQIWEPERFRAHLTEATDKVRALKKSLGSKGAGEPPGASG